MRFAPRWAVLPRAECLDPTRYPRLGIVGGPGVGKTYLVDSMIARGDGRPIVRTDDFISHGWSGCVPAILATVKDGPCIIEGIQVARCCRAGLKLDLVLLINRPGRTDASSRRIASSILNILTDGVGSPVAVLGE